MRLLCVAVLAAVLPALAGCDEDAPPTSTSAPTSGPTTGPGGGGGGGDGGGDIGGGGAGGDGGGTVIENTDCTDPAVASTELYAAASAPDLRQLARVGTRWAASGEDGHVFFDADGANADATATVLLPNRNAIGSEGDTLGVAASNDNVIQFQRLDANGASVAGPAGMALLEPIALSVASNAGDTLVTWGVNTRLHARGFTAAGVFAGDAFELVIGAYSTYLFFASAARGDEVAVVWSGDPTVGENRTQVIRADLDGPIGDPIDLYESALPHSVTQVAATDEGYVVLLTGPPPEREPLVILLDVSGTPMGEPYRLEGGDIAHGIASTGDGFAVIVGRATGEPQLRAFDLEVEPLGPWVCLGGAHNDTVPAAIASDGEGYAALFTLNDGAVMFNRTDAVGTGAP